MNLSLQFRIHGHQKNTELVLNPLGPVAPASFKNDCRRVADGMTFFGQNKFDKFGRQINDFVIEYYSEDKTAQGNKGIVKQELRAAPKSCPERLRGQFCSVYYDLDSLCYKI